MLPIEVWDLVGRGLARELYLTASKDEFWMYIQRIWNSLPEADIQHLFDCMLHCIAAIIATCDGYTKY
ncbi:hypothetical protein TNCV_3941781 [Trichonephila clavipes]|uniref:Uncharacterized protein n=1 Tax=Trichonephila clavipes TaxID=2585209 RepID=A0A8X6VW39_TRICX|nr:hypothetical protein TNCV_3941781 [Trichonephila clavipes]